MNAVKGLFALLAICSVVGCSSGRVTPDLQVGERVPYASFTLLNGDPLTLEQVRGKPAVVIFWASTCTFSPKTVERLNHIIGKIGSKRATFIAASLDKAEDIPAIKEMIPQRDMNNFIHAISGNEEYDQAYLALRGKELPYIVLVAPDGSVVYSGTSVGPVEDYFAKTS